MEEAERIRISREVKMKTQALTFNLISGFHLIDGFKAEIRARLMKKEGQPTSLALIKMRHYKLSSFWKKRKENQLWVQMEPMVMERN
jgi:hypothetical protein